MLYISRVKVQESPEEGKIYPPLLIVEYGELTENDVAANLPVKIKFEVEYNMENRITYIMDVCILIFSNSLYLSVSWIKIKYWIIKNLCAPDAKIYNNILNTCFRKILPTTYFNRSTST